jgi:hypothetical protein
MARNKQIFWVETCQKYTTANSDRELEAQDIENRL